MDDPNTFYLVNGLRKRTYAVKANPDILDYKVRQTEKGKSADELLQRALQKVRYTEERNEGCSQRSLTEKYESATLATLKLHVTKQTGQILKSLEGSWSTWVANDP